MSQAEDLLNSLTEDEVVAYSVDTATEPHIVINADRTVTVPEVLKHIAVQGDHNIETVTFDCPRYWDGHDLSKMNVRVVFQRPDGHREPHLVENLRVDEIDTTTIHFDWTISGNVTLVRGNISFTVCAKLADVEGIVEREWHTRLNQDLIVDEGMDCSGDEIIEQNPDILESILVRLDVIESGGTGNGSSQTVVEPAEDDIPKVFFGAALPQTKDDTIMSFRYISKTKDIRGYCKTKAQGNSSMSFPKKNQTVKLYADSACTEKLKVDFKGWGKQNKFCFKANWVDLTHARNVVTARLWGDVVQSRSDYSEIPVELRESPNHGAIDGFPVKVYAGGVYQGRYTLNIPKDAWMANMDDELDEHCILCGENYTSGCFRAAANIDGADWSDEIHDTVPASIKTRWNEIIGFVMNATDADFKAGLSNYFDITSLLDYYLFGVAACNLDGFGKNQLYMTYDGLKWYATVYDLDGTWGMFWNGATFLAADYSRVQFQDYKDSIGNLLYIRLEKLFLDGIKERWAELRQSVLTADHLINRFERMTDIASKELVAEDYATTTGGGAFTEIPSQDTNNIQQIRQFIVDRLAYCDEFISSLDFTSPDEIVTGNLVDLTSEDTHIDSHYLMSGALTEQPDPTYNEKMIVTNFIPAVMYDIVRFKGLDREAPTSGTNPRIEFYDSDKVYLFGMNLTEQNLGASQNNLPTSCVTDENGVTAYEVMMRGDKNAQFVYNDFCYKCAYIRFSAHYLTTPEDVVVTINDGITEDETVQSENLWNVSNRTENVVTYKSPADAVELDYNSYTRGVAVSGYWDNSKLVGMEIDGEDIILTKNPNGYYAVAFPFDLESGATYQLEYTSDGNLKVTYMYYDDSGMYVSNTDLVANSPAGTYTRPFTVGEHSSFVLCFTPCQDAAVTVSGISLTKVN